MDSRIHDAVSSFVKWQVSLGKVTNVKAFRETILRDWSRPCNNWKVQKELQTRDSRKVTDPDHPPEGGGQVRSGSRFPAAMIRARYDLEGITQRLDGPWQQNPACGPYGCNEARCCFWPKPTPGEVEQLYARANEICDTYPRIGEVPYVPVPVDLELEAEADAARWFKEQPSAYRKVLLARKRKERLTWCELRAQVEA